MGVLALPRKSGLVRATIANEPKGSPYHWESFLRYLKGVYPGNLIGLWLQNERYGTVCQDYSGRYHNGAYTGVGLGRPGPLAGLRAGSFDGSTTYTSFQGDALAAAFSPSSLTVLAFARVTPLSVWTDSTAHYLLQFRTDVNNRIFIAKGLTDYQLDMRYIAGGTTQQRQAADVTARADWFMVMATASLARNEVLFFVQGGQVGAPLTGIGSWSGSLAVSVAGANLLTPTSVWQGDIGLCALWNTAIPPMAVKEIYRNWKRAA